MLRLLGLQLQNFDYASYTDDVGIEWRKWLRSFETMARASRISDDDWKNDLLLHYAGPSVQQLFDTLPDLPCGNLRGPLLNVENYTPNMSSYEETVAKLNTFFLPSENTTYERHLLRQIEQKAGENIDAFTVKLRVQAERCGFGDKVEENIKDQIIEKCQSVTLRRELLKKGDASLEEVLRVAKIYETVAHQEKSFAADNIPKTQINEVSKIEAKPSYGNPSRFVGTRRVECHRCGYFGHLARDDKCPAKGKSCNKCGGRDHFAKKCRKRKQPAEYQYQRDIKNSNKIASVGHDSPQSSAVQNIADGRSEYIFNVTTIDSNGEMNCEIGGVNVIVVIDSGSKYNLLSQSAWEQMKSQKVAVFNQRQEVSKSFKAYGGQELPLLGAFTAIIKFGNQADSAEFYVVKGRGKILIGRDTASAMGILKIGIEVNDIDAIQTNKLGTIKDVVIDIPIKTDVAPVIQPYRRVPVPLEKLVDKKIDELLSHGIIEKVNESSKWVSPVVVVPKGDDVRICVDMRRANVAVERENHPLPTMEDFLPHLAKAKIFSRLDVKNAFHQVG